MVLPCKRGERFCCVGANELCRRESVSLQDAGCLVQDKAANDTCNQHAGDIHDHLDGGACIGGIYASLRQRERKSCSGKYRGDNNAEEGQGNGK